MRTQADRNAHQVLRVLGERLRSGSRPGNRTDGLRIALAIEGGGMRGTVSAGMAFALHELGVVRAFDAVYGASAGAITGAWLLSSNPGGLRGWAEPSYAKALIRWSALLRGRPVVDVRTLVEIVYQTEFPMDFGSVLASDVEYHPLATDAATGASTDLRPLIRDPADLRLALRASASLPFLAGPPVRLRDQRFYDAGVAESIPFRTPIAQGATHILVLRSRRAVPAAITADPVAADGALADGGLPRGAVSIDGIGIDGVRMPRPPRSVRLLTRTTLRRESAQLRAALLTRGIRTAADIARIAELEAAGRALAVFPPPSAPPVSRLTTDGPLLAAAFEAGREAVHALAGDWLGARAGVRDGNPTPGRAAEDGDGRLRRTGMAGYPAG
jgi:predicted patatin/cPLA2 family phospholipase